MKIQWCFILLVLWLVPGMVHSQTSLESVNNSGKVRILQINLREEVNSVTWIGIQKGLREAVQEKYDAVLVNMNTYGGEVLYADSIRTAILDAPMPVYVFINNNAASAGALISIACDKIFMRSGATIGASTVVDQTGAAAPDKYQSYMRGIIRATAEAHGKDTLVQGKDTVIRWLRDPKIAEAMVDPDLFIPGVVDTGKVLTLTANEALQLGYCDGMAETADEVLSKYLGFRDYEITLFRLNTWDSLKGHLMGTAFRVVLIMLIIGGIWFELQAPGIGFASLVALLAAVFYFAPLYMDGLAQNWEIVVFILGLILLLLEVFVIPGFGIAGVSGILCILTGLTFALIDNATFEFSLHGMDNIGEPLLLVSLSISAAILLCVWVTSKIGKKSGIFRKMALTSTQVIEEGYIGVPPEITGLVGQTGVAETILRPSGKVRIADKLYDAISEFGYVEKGETVRVTRSESGQIYVVRRES